MHANFWHLLFMFSLEEKKTGSFSWRDTFLMNVNVLSAPSFGGRDGTVRPASFRKKLDSFLAISFPSHWPATHGCSWPGLCLPACALSQQRQPALEGDTPDELASLDCPLSRKQVCSDTPALHPASSRHATSFHLLKVYHVPRTIQFHPLNNL